MFKKITFVCLFSLGVLVLAACGGSSSNVPAQPTDLPAASSTLQAAPTADPMNAANELATSVAVVQNPPTPAPNLQAATPRPEIQLTRTFHYASLDGTLLGWQVRGNDGALCTSLSKLYVALRVKFVNTASKLYILTGDEAHVVTKTGEPPDTLGQGKVFFGKDLAGSLDIPADTTVEATLCADIGIKDDPDTMVLSLGPREGEQVRVPLAP